MSIVDVSIKSTLESATALEGTVKAEAKTEAQKAVSLLARIRGYFAGILRAIEGK